MKVFRAQEILRAEDRIEVELNGVSVWIDSVDPEKETAKVHVEDQPADSRVVPVDELQEVT
ncbi:H-type small acid-soluble spore protein [Paenibacillus mucilaginosus]|uniref:Small acid-soluble spore protein n=3 Tax=Paenibacillus mucilaginosus TaxID=61624 RepID=H6NQN4_9BACL|nr:H-type small acid-soluble spore protein [Paenibacillus mucilaginosus]AEI45852.1 small acid-soluble spore protein [Paenibacillus mucilaginosus KNP414]AFC33502.1 small acid-soluble spore protein [Paenibacillus mucilaginosus 3016]AFH65822.1 spore protein [Paenibacillus mucilaginosus K02]MCG7217809.1 H-type small acid-soluble spore protein [Paenibacillus mucilaginosus]WDM27219.1 H-type small acid-soluble spore protein [Paenibacillus mucilaginosus]